MSIIEEIKKGKYWNKKIYRNNTIYLDNTKYTITDNEKVELEALVSKKENAKKEFYNNELCLGVFEGIEVRLKNIDMYLTSTEKNSVINTIKLERIFTMNNKKVWVWSYQRKRNGRFFGLGFIKEKGFFEVPESKIKE